MSMAMMLMASFMPSLAPAGTSEGDQADQLPRVSSHDRRADDLVASPPHVDAGEATLLPLDDEAVDPGERPGERIHGDSSLGRGSGRYAELFGVDEGEIHPFHDIEPGEVIRAGHRPKGLLRDDVGQNDGVRRAGEFQALRVECR